MKQKPAFESWMKQQSQHQCCRKDEDCEVEMQEEESYQELNEELAIKIYL
jgi:hypothetical protein